MTEQESDTWLMPLENLHLIAMEIAHSCTAEETSDLIQSHVQSLSELADFTFQHRVRLVNPLLSLDAQGLALSFLPAAREVLPHGRSIEEDVYSYHHLRRDLHSRLERAGVHVDSRYIVPSAHVSIARFIIQKDFTQAQPNDQIIDRTKIEKWIDNIEEINYWLQNEYWPRPANNYIGAGGEWMVGEEKGLDLRQGALWYGDGDTVRLGKGF